MPLLAFGGRVFATTLVIAGAWLLYVGSTRENAISVAGRTLESTTVGMIAVLIGVASAFLLDRRSLAWLNRSAQRSEAPKQGLASSHDWPGTATVDALRRKLQSLSETQLKILEEIEIARGLEVAELPDRSNLRGFTPFQLGVRCILLRREGLIDYDEEREQMTLSTEALRLRREAGVATMQALAKQAGSQSHGPTSIGGAA